MPGKGRRVLVPLLVVLAATSSPCTVSARQSAPPVLRAVRAQAVPVLDGRVLDDPAWADAPPGTGFTQTQPDDGRPVSEATEIRVLYTADTLYVAAVLHDRMPERISTSEARRDASLDETDSIRFILDTYADGQNGFVFGTNPAGIEYDAQVAREGQGGFGAQRQQAGAGAGFNINWDGSWVVRTHVGSFGWSAEFAIPFRTLRFADERQQSWGFNAQRIIRRRNERAFWAPLPRQFDLNRVSFAGRLELEVPRTRNLKITPYGLGQAVRDYDVDPASTDRSGEVGVDVKYSVTPSLTLDATVNTDFAQVEVDEQQVNLDRFNLFFPEKRPFFLENAGLFTVGETSEVELFFSRRIGLSGGRAVPILGGARLSGQVGDVKIGLLNMLTRSIGDGGDVVPANNFTVARAQREWANRSSVGMLITARQGLGEDTPREDRNRVVAADGRLGIGRFGTVSGFVARSFDPDGGDAPFAANVEANYESVRWRFIAGFTQVAASFNPELGFLRRTDYRKVTLLAFRSVRMHGRLGLQEVRPHVSYRGYWGMDGFHETGFLHVDNHWEWPGGHEVHTGVNFTREGVRDAFEIGDGVIVPAGTYDHREAMIVAFTDQSRGISLNTRTIIGGFFGGDRVSFAPDVRLRGGEAFTVEFGANFNLLDLPAGKYTTNLYRTRISYAFTPRIFAQGLLQYAEQAGIWSANLRFGWMQAAGTGLFVVLNQTSDLDGALDEALQRGVTVKYSYLIDYFR